MSTRENIRLIARAPLNYREVDIRIKKKDYYKFFFLSNICFVSVTETSQGDVSFHTQNIIFYG